jgi:hypothetical protein
MIAIALPRAQLRRRALLATTFVMTVGLLAGCTVGDLPSPPPVNVSGYRITFATPSPTGAAKATPAPSTGAGSGAGQKPATTQKPVASVPTPTAKATPKPTAATVAAAKNVKVVVPSQHFSILLPTAWVPLVVDGSSVEDGIERVLKATGSQTTPAQLESVIDQMHAVLPAGVKFWGVKPSSFNMSKGFISVVMILGSPAPGATLAQVETQSAAQLQAMGTSVSAVTHKQVKLANGSAVWFSYTQTTAAAGGRIGTFTANTWFILRDGYGYAIYFATLKPATAAELREFSSIAGSIAPTN